MSHKGNASFTNQLVALMSKHDHGIEDVAQLANTETWVVREWTLGNAAPSPVRGREVLNALDDPAATRNTARGFLGVPAPWDRRIPAFG